MSRHFHAAPWPAALKVSSSLGTVLLAGIGYAAYGAVPTPSGFAHSLGLCVVFVLPGILTLSLFFTVTGYDVDGAVLSIQRLVWSTRFPLDGLSDVRIEPDACKGSIRIVGNAGLFSFTGLYESRRLGRYRLFATDPTRSVVLVLPTRVVVITPAFPQAFVDHLHHLFPRVGVDSEGRRA